MARSQPSMLKPRRCTWSFPVDIAITESISNPSPPGIDKVLFVASPDLRTKLASVTDSVVRDTESYAMPQTFVMVEPSPDDMVRGWPRSELYEL